MLDEYFEMLVKEAEYAPGIPSKKTVHPILSVKHPDTWQFCVQAHAADKAGKHLDLRLGHSATGHAHSWAMRHWPEPGETRLAIQQPAHSIGYMDFQGKLVSGYGKGTVELARRGKTEVLTSSPDHVRFDVPTKQGQESYLLRRTKGSSWILRNITPTSEDKTAANARARDVVVRKVFAENAPRQSITFPEDEHAALRSRLEDGKPIYTTRISAEKNRYKPGTVVQAPWGQALRVTDVRHVQSVGEHPFVDELTPAQKKQLDGHDMSLVRLQSVRGGLAGGFEYSYSKTATNTHTREGSTYSKIKSTLLDKDIPVLSRLPKSDKGLEFLRQSIKASPVKINAHRNVAVVNLNLKDLGFRPTRTAIPMPWESVGAESWRSGKLHAHKAGDVYLVHEDTKAPEVGVRALFELRHGVKDVLPALSAMIRGSEKKNPVILKESSVEASMQTKSAVKLAQYRAMAEELAVIDKQAGVMSTLLQPIAGTKDWLIPTAKKLVPGAGQAAKKTVGTAAKTVGSVRPPGGAWDVSRQAAAMGI